MAPVVGLVHCVKCRPDVTLTLPAATRQGVVIALLPLMLIALMELELDTISHPGELTFAEPLTVMAWLAVGSSARMQAPEADIVVTARAETMGLLDRKRPARKRGCGCWMMTSIAVALLVWPPDAGGWFTVTVTPFWPSTYPCVAVIPLAWVWKSVPSLLL